MLVENRDEGIALEDPSTGDERAAVAATCSGRLELGIPVLVDGPDDAVARAYGGWPDRLYLVGRDGRIAFQGGEGPFGFQPDELRAAIEEELRRNSASAGRPPG